MSARWHDIRRFRSFSYINSGDTNGFQRLKIFVIHSGTVFPLLYILCRQSFISIWLVGKIVNVLTDQTCCNFTNFDLVDKKKVLVKLVNEGAKPEV